jgi:TRAP-type C4-dicarboxylate transport system permease small subunit
MPMPDRARSPRSLFRTMTASYSWLLSQLLVISVAVLIIPVSLQIFSRYTDLIPSYIWTEEMARFLFVWSIMLGAIIGIRESTHFEVDIWPRHLSPRAQAALRLISRIAVLVIAVVFVWGGLEFTRFAFNRISELAELPLWLIHVAWPLAGASWILFLGEQMYDDVGVLTGRSRAPHELSTAEIEAQSGGHE